MFIKVIRRPLEVGNKQKDARPVHRSLPISAPAKPLCGSHLAGAAGRETPPPPGARRGAGLGAAGGAGPGASRHHVPAVWGGIWGRGQEPRRRETSTRGRGLKVRRALQLPGSLLGAGPEGGAGAGPGAGRSRPGRDLPAPRFLGISLRCCTGRSALLRHQGRGGR